MFVDAALIWRLTTACKRVLDDVPQNQDSTHEWYRRDKVPFDARIVVEGIDIHAKKPTNEYQGQEDEGDPG